MDIKDINYTIKTKRLRLTFERILMYFGSIIALMSVSIYLAVDKYANNTDSITYLIWLIVFFVGLFLFYYKWTQLNFIVFKVELKRKEIYFAIDKLCETNEWNFKEKRFKTALFDLNEFKGGEISTYSGIFSDSQTIRIILKNDEIYINCLPEKGDNYFARKWTPEKIFNEITELEKRNH